MDNVTVVTDGFQTSAGTVSDGYLDKDATTHFYQQHGRSLSKGTT